LLGYRAAPLQGPFKYPGEFQVERTEMSSGSRFQTCTFSLRAELVLELTSICGVQKHGRVQIAIAKQVYGKMSAGSCGYRLWLRKAKPHSPMAV